MEHLKLNREMSNKYKPLTVYDSQNTQFPYFVEEWDECFTEEEIKDHLKDLFMTDNILVGGE